MKTVLTFVFFFFSVTAFALYPEFDTPASLLCKDSPRTIYDHVGGAFSAAGFADAAKNVNSQLKKICAASDGKGTDWVINQIDYGKACAATITDPALLQQCNASAKAAKTATQDFIDGYVAGTAIDRNLCMTHLAAIGFIANDPKTSQNELKKDLKAIEDAQFAGKPAQIAGSGQ